MRERFLGACRRLGWKVAFMAGAVIAIPALASATTIGNSVSVTTDLTVAGNTSSSIVTSSGYIEIGKVNGNSNASFANGALNVAGASLLVGAVRIDGVVTVGSSIVPGSDNALDLGAFGTSWRALYTSGTAFIAGVSSTSGLYPTVNNTYDIGAYGRAWGSIMASGTMEASSFQVNDLIKGTAGAVFRPQTTNLTSVGAFGNAWRNFFASGTSFLAGVSSTSGLYPASNRNNTLDLGDFSFAWRNLFASGTAYIGGVSSTSGLYPTANNSAHIGQFGSAWGNLFASGTVRFVSTTVQDPNTTTTVYMTSGQVQRGGRIILKGANGATCYQMYFGDPEGDGVGPIGITTSTITCPNP